jgi:transcriptional regulator with XRE-family HTH domain
MTKIARRSGVNGAMIRKLRRREHWSQGELAEKLAVHRVTLARWESNLVEPPPEAADQMAKIFGIDPKTLYLDEATEDEQTAITDPWLKKLSLYKLQKYTRPALRALEMTAHQIAQRVELPVQRIQELLDGEKPTTLEIQRLRDSLGPDFNPTSILKKRIRMEAIDPDNVPAKLDVLLQRLVSLESRLEQLEAIQRESLEKSTRVETFQLNLLQKLDKALRLLNERRSVRH